MITQLLPRLPTLPRANRILALPGKVIPGPVHSSSLALILNRVLAEALHNQELQFLEHRILQIYVADLSLDYRLTLQGNQLARADSQSDPDVRFAGEAREFMLLGLNKEDPDTLFFQRRLLLEGDTELGLEIKNFLYTLDEDFLPKPVRQLAEKALNLF